MWAYVSRLETSVVEYIAIHQITALFVGVLYTWQSTSTNWWVTPSTNIATLDSTPLHSTILHCTALHSTPLHFTAHHCTPLLFTSLQSTQLHVFMYTFMYVLTDVSSHYITNTPINQSMSGITFYFQVSGRINNKHSRSGCRSSHDVTSHPIPSHHIPSNPIPYVHTYAAMFLSWTERLRSCHLEWVRVLALLPLPLCLLSLSTKIWKAVNRIRWSR